MRLAPCIAAFGLAVGLAGCSLDVADEGGTSPVGDGLGDAARSNRATWQIIDLADGTVSTAASLPGLASDPAYRDRLLIFRRLVKSGSWGDHLERCRFANRTAVEPGRRSPCLGFRLVIDPAKE